MGRNNTRAAKNIAKMYEQLGLTQDDIFHKTKLLLSIYRDVVWATLSDCRCVNAEINYYGDDLNDALIYVRMSTSTTLLTGSNALIPFKWCGSFAMCAVNTVALTIRFGRSPRMCDCQNRIVEEVSESEYD